MIILKILAKIVALPIELLLLIVYLVGSFCTGIVSVIFGILSTLFWGTAIVGYVFGALTGHEAIDMIVVAFVVFVIPQICHLMLDVLGSFREITRNFIRS